MTAFTITCQLIDLSAGASPDHLGFCTVALSDGGAGSVRHDDAHLHSWKRDTDCTCTCKHTHIHTYIVSHSVTILQCLLQCPEEVFLVSCVHHECVLCVCPFCARVASVFPSERVTQRWQGNRLSAPSQPTSCQPREDKNTLLSITLSSKSI